MFLLLLHYVPPTSQPPTFVAHEFIYLLKRKFLLKTFVAGQCGATYESVSLLRCVFGKEFDLKAATAPRIPHGELSVADEQLWRVTTRAIWVEVGSSG